MKDSDKKILGWLGFTVRPYPEPRLEPLEKAWYDPNGVFYSGYYHPPILNIQFFFDYAVPKLREMGWDFALYTDKYDTSCEFYGKGYGGDYEHYSGEYETSNDDPAEAFGSALLQLISSKALDMV